MWTGPLPDSRAEAARICVTICRIQNPAAFEACRLQAERDQPDFGVYAGKDYAPTVTRTCEGPGCDNPLPNVVKSGRARRFCGVNCRHNFNYEQRAARVKTCAGCGAEFHWSKQSEAQWAARKFCSLRCTGAAKAAA
jgi:hypothetical protein